jgi:NADH-quinone oxidoreductase subunit N
MTLFLLSLAGWPPFAGWYAKFVVFQAALAAGQTSTTVLAVFMAVMTVVAFFYYLSICGRIWFSQPAEEAPAAPATSPLAGLAIGLSTAAVIVLGILPGLLVQYAPTASLVASRG